MIDLMNDEKAPSILICPVCSALLIESDKYYHCEKNHTFDKSRYGYVNLLLSHQKKSQHPGDNKEMVKSRYEFLSQDFYRPIAASISEVLVDSLKDSPIECELNIADIGCGVGYYLSYIQKTFPTRNIQYWGIDVSKEAIQLAAQHFSNIHWLVGNAIKLPFVSQSVNRMVSVFSPFDTEEMRRICHPDGQIIIVTPAQDHLIELRHILFDDIHAKEDDRNIKQVQAHFKLIRCQPLRFSLQLQTQADIQHLFRMTPFYWRTSVLKKDLLSQLTELDLTIDLMIWVFC